jgi:hypothetical protein
VEDRRIEALFAELLEEASGAWEGSDSTVEPAVGDSTVEPAVGDKVETVVDAS